MTRDEETAERNACDEWWHAQPNKGASIQEAWVERARRAEEDAQTWREILTALLREIPHNKRPSGNAPGHGHVIPGIWDSDNGALAGTECAWCKAWNAAHAAIAHEQATRG